MVAATFRFVGVVESPPWALGVWLDEADNAISVQPQPIAYCQLMHPICQSLFAWFHPANALVQEKFLTIRWYLCGVVSYGRHASDDLINFLKWFFAALQVPFETVIRCKGVRYSFINYNFLFRRGFDLYHASVRHYGKDFPPLKSKKKREDVILWYLDLLEYTKLPYINR